MKRNRIRFLQIFFIIFTLGIFSRLFYWQILVSDKLSAQAESQHFNVYEIQAQRGQIKTNDQYSLVGNQPTYTVYASIKELDKSPKEITDKLTPLFLDYELN